MSLEDIRLKIYDTPDEPRKEKEKECSVCNRWVDYELVYEMDGKDVCDNCIAKEVA